LRSGAAVSRTVRETGDDAIADFKVIDFEPRSIASPMFSWPRKSIQLEEIARSVMEENLKDQAERVAGLRNWKAIAPRHWKPRRLRRRPRSGEGRTRTPEPLMSAAGSRRSIPHRSGDPMSGNSEKPAARPMRQSATQSKSSDVQPVR
jgi:hypothetical protein